MKYLKLGINICNWTQQLLCYMYILWIIIDSVLLNIPFENKNHLNFGIVLISICTSLYFLNRVLLWIKKGFIEVDNKMRFTAGAKDFEDTYHQKNFKPKYN